MNRKPDTFSLQMAALTLKIRWMQILHCCMYLSISADHGLHLERTVRLLFSEPINCISADLTDKGNMWMCRLLNIWIWRYLLYGLMPFIIWINIEKVKMLKHWKVFNNNKKTDDEEKRKCHWLKQCSYF